MKILKLVVSGVPLLRDKCEIDLLSLQRVTPDNAEKMSVVFSNGTKKFHQNNVLSFIGINASGKTTILKLITFICRMLNNEPLNTMDCSEILDDLNGDNQAVFDTYFYSENETVIQPAHVLSHRSSVQNQRYLYKYQPAFPRKFC